MGECLPGGVRFGRIQIPPRQGGAQARWNEDSLPPLWACLRFPALGESLRVQCMWEA